MGVVVDVLFNLKRRTLLLHFHTDDDVEVFRLFSRRRVILTAYVKFGSIRILHIVTSVVCVRSIEACRLKFGREFCFYIILTREVHHGAGLALGVDHEERGNLCVACHLGVVSTEGRSDVYDTRTVVRSYIVAGNHAECQFREFYKLVSAYGKYLFGVCLCVCVYEVCREVTCLFKGLHPGHELLVVHAYEVCTLHFGNHFVGDYLVARLVVGKCDFCAFSLQVSVEAALCNHGRYGSSGVGVVSLHHDIVNRGTYAERGVRGKRPGRCCPRKEHGRSPCAPSLGSVGDFKLCGHRSVLHIAVATGLVQFVA